MATTVKLTLEEFLAREDTEPASEYVCGEVIQKPMPSRGHAFIQGFLFHVLFQFLTGTRLGRVGTELRCVFGPPGRERGFVPDVVYVAMEQLATDEAASFRAQRSAPDLAIEILSPEQNAAEFADKIQFYLLHGVRLVWVVDPMKGTIKVFAPGQEARTFTAGDTLDGGDVLPGFSLAIDDIFAQLQV